MRKRKAGSAPKERAVSGEKAKKRRGRKKPTPEERVEPPKTVDLRALAALRKKVKEKLPDFIRQESWRYRRVKGGWIKPKGIDSKMRLRVKGWPKLVKIGYRGPAFARHLHPSGFRDVLVHNTRQLQGLNPQTDAARIASTVGARKREQLMARAKELGVRVLNPTGLRMVKAEK